MRIDQSDNTIHNDINSIEAESEEMMCDLGSDNNEFEIPLTGEEKKRKLIFNRAKAMPITSTQKRARWIPGHRYMPILLLQWLWHPIASLFHDGRKASGHVNDNKLHGDHDYHQDYLQIGRSASASHAIYASRSGGDIFME